MGLLNCLTHEGIEDCSLMIPFLKGHRLIHHDTLKGLRQMFFYEMLQHFCVRRKSLHLKRFHYSDENNVQYRIYIKQIF